MIASGRKGKYKKKASQEVTVSTRSSLRTSLRSSMSSRSSTTRRSRKSKITEQVDDPPAEVFSTSISLAADLHGVVPDHAEEFVMNGRIRGLDTPRVSSVESGCLPDLESVAPYTPLAQREDSGRLSHDKPTVCVWHDARSGADLRMPSWLTQKYHTCRNKVTSACGECWSWIQCFRGNSDNYDEVPNGVSWFHYTQTSFFLLCFMLGPGLMMYPSIFVRLGWVAGSAFTVLGGLISYVICIQGEDRLVYLRMGGEKDHGWFLSICNVFNSVMKLAFFIRLISMNLVTLCAQYPSFIEYGVHQDVFFRRKWEFYAVAVCVPLFIACFNKSRRYFSFRAVLGSLSSLVCCVLLTYAMTSQSDFSHRPASQDEDILDRDVSFYWTMALDFVTFIYFICPAEILGLVKDQAEYRVSLQIDFLIAHVVAVIAYLAVGCVSLAYIGPDISQNLMLSLGSDSNLLHWGIMASSFLSLAMVVNQLLASITSNLPEQRSTYSRKLMRVVIFGVTLIYLLGCPYVWMAEKVAVYVNLTVWIIIPVISHLMLCRKLNVSNSALYTHKVILAFSFVLLGLGMGQCAYDIKQTYDTRPAESLPQATWNMRVENLHDFPPHPVYGHPVVVPLHETLFRSRSEHDQNHLRANRRWSKRPLEINSLVS